jgi:hypothetical protein
MPKRMLKERLKMRWLDWSDLKTLNLMDGMRRVGIESSGDWL